MYSMTAKDIDRSFPDDFIPAKPRKDRGTLTTSEIVAMAWDDQF
jgi:hypothetical protein